MGEIWIFAEQTNAQAELLAGAKTLGDKAVALLIGSQADAETVIHQGADEVLWLGEPAENVLPEDYVDTIWDVLSDRKPVGVLFSISARNKVIAGRLAARLGTSAISDAAVVELVDGVLTVSRRVYGGGAIRTEQALTGTAIILVNAGTFQPEAAETGRSGPITEVAFVDPIWTVTVVEHREKPVAEINLAAAKSVVGVGRGIKQQDDLAQVDELAEALGAEIGCTRPLAENNNWFPHNQYIGVTGANIKPELYLALGISGQVQHMVGVEGANIVVAVNEDKNAPIFKISDYGLVGDLYEALPILIAALKNR